MLIQGGQIVIREGARVVATTNGTLVNLLPTEFTANIDVAFPDFQKSLIYHWRWFNDYNSLAEQVGQFNACASGVVAVPQEFAQASILAAAPAGADIFVARVRINRINHPSHDWIESPMTPLVIQNQWLPFSGSVLVEAEVGMARAFSLYISGGNLVLHRQQSVCVAPGGYGVYGGPIGWNVGDPDGERRGGEILARDEQGFLVYRIEEKFSSRVISGGSFGFSAYQSHRISGFGATDSCSMVDPTDYASTYRVNIVGKFGRRS